MQNSFYNMAGAKNVTWQLISWTFVWLTFKGLKCLQFVCSHLLVTRQPSLTAKPFSHFRYKTTWQGEYKREHFKQLKVLLSLSHSWILNRVTLPHLVKIQYKNNHFLNNFEINIINIILFVTDHAFKLCSFNSREKQNENGRRRFFKALKSIVQWNPYYMVN